MSYWAAIILCLAGFAALALATERQQFDVFGRALAPGATRGLRSVGWIALALALAVLVAHSGWALGLVVFSGVKSLMAGVVYGGLIVRGQLTLEGVRCRARGPRR